MRAIIIANGPTPKYPPSLLKMEGDWIVAADGGTRTALFWGWIPHTIIGDLDSLSAELEQRLRDMDCQFITYPSRKDWTDLELALQHVVEGGATEVIVLGARGGRLDQELANILLLSRSEWAGARIRLLDGPEEACVIRDEFVLSGQVGDCVSLIPLSAEVAGVTTAGLEWPLAESTLHFGSTLGISNMMTGPAARIVVKTGALLVVHSARDAAKPGNELPVAGRQKPGKPDYTPAGPGHNATARRRKP
jgi:thiamine pyrophosphokinase